MTEFITEEFNPKQGLAKLGSRVVYRYDEKLPARPELILYPNPTTGSINILNAGAAGCIRQVEVFNNTGSLVKQFDGQPIPFYVDVIECLASIDLSPLEQGIYLLRITTGNGQTETKRVQKQ